MRKFLFVTILVLLCCDRNAFAAKDSIAIFFPFNQSTLTIQAQKIMDAALYQGNLSEKMEIQIIGHTDDVGNHPYNLNLSKQRANSVKNYLIQSGFKANKITLILGKGKVGAHPITGADGNPNDRRVDIVVAKSQAVPAEKSPFNAPRPNMPKSLSSADLSKVEVGETLILDRIYFIAGRHITRPESEPALDTLFKILNQNPNIRIRIEGHVCCIPAGIDDAMDDDTHSNHLSLNRARAIRDYLVQRGLDGKRVEFIGLGHQKPIIMPETTEEEADKNRRVEIRVIQ